MKLLRFVFRVFLVVPWVLFGLLCVTLVYRGLRQDQRARLNRCWSACLMRPDVICLDTGCVWGGALSALRLHDRKLVQVKCKRFQDPNGD
ncbi:hypothetical protein L546_3510 [Bordetella pertussis H897]|nr:hypothetical protein L546_3510 [Bordetella pertussis H897]